jgi:cytochrome P450
MYGERLRSVVHGIAEPAFDVMYRRTRFLHLTLHVVNAPEMITRVLLDHSANYIRPYLTRQILKPVVGNGLLSADGEDWRKQRRIVAPTFAPPAVAGMAKQMAEATARNIQSGPPGRTLLDMDKVATATTMAVIADTLFSGDARLASGEAAQHIERVISAAGQARLMAMIGLQAYDPSPTMVRARASRRWLRTMLTTLVRERGAGNGGDFFGGLIQALHSSFPTDQAEVLAVDNAITFYAAGHETTATALSWAIYLLAAQPELQDQVRAEAIEALDGDIGTLIERLPILRQVLDETLRLYPSAVQIIRAAAGEDELGGHPVAKGDLVIIYPWLVHRHRKLWDDPDAFNHTRFAADAKAKIGKFQYIPFGAGPRICVGARFAIVEALVILTHWLSARRFSLPDGLQPIPTGTVTLRPKGGMPLIIEAI